MLNNVPYEFLEELIEARKRSGIKQGEIAKALNCTRQNISAFESGITSSGKVLLYYIEKFGGEINGKGSDQEA